MEPRIALPRIRNRPSSIPVAFLAGVHDMTPRDGAIAALVLAGTLFVAGVAFGYCLFSVDCPTCASETR